MLEEFKHTEVGLIPIGWDYLAIGKEIDLLTGFPFPSNEYVNDGIKLLRGSNVKRGVTDWTEDNTKYWNEVSFILRQYLLQEGDIVVAMDGSLVGRSFARLTNKDLPALLLQRVARVRSSSIDMGYLKEFICSDYFTKYCDTVKTASAIPHISPKDIRNFKIPIPPNQVEQTNIATALNDANTLILGMGKLIAKKNAIKQGVMNELLKPKDGWNWITIEKLGKPYGGLSGKSKSDFKDGNYPYIPFLNIMSNPIIDTNYYDYVKIGTSESQNKALKGDLFFNGSSETPEEVGMCSVLLDDVSNLYLNSFCFGFRLFNQEEAQGLYLAYYFRSSYGRKKFYILAQGATRHNLSKSNFLKIEFKIPKIDEQRKITEIIRDMDIEICELEEMLEKQKMLKQGMMQVLLTGKIRLI